MISLFNRGLQMAVRESGQQASVIHKRGYFNSQELKIAAFQARAEKLEQNKEISLEKIRSDILQAVAKPDTFPKRLDVDNLLHLAKSDTDLELGLKAVSHLNSRLNRTQRLLLGSNVARAYYMQNKTDKAIELYHNKESKAFDSPDLAGLILMNKLIEDKRYDDAISFYDKVVNNQVTEVEKKKLIGFLELYLEALLEKNTPESLQKAKSAAEAFKSKLTYDKLRNALFKLILLAVNQNDAAYALQIISTAKVEDRITSNRIFVNLKLIGLLKNNQAAEFVKEADEIKGKQFKEGGHFFSETIEQAKLTANSLTDESLKKSLLEIVQNAGDKLIQGELKTIILKKSILTEKSEDDATKRNRSSDGGVQRNRDNQRRPYQNRNNNNNYAQNRQNEGNRDRDRNDGYNNRERNSYVNRQRNDRDAQQQQQRRDSRPSNQNRNYRARNDDDSDNEGFANPPRRN